MNLPENPTKEQMIEWMKSLPPEDRRGVLQEIVDECKRLLTEDEQAHSE